MKYVITGGAGHISRPLVNSLLKAGHQVTVIGRNEANLKPLIDAGAGAAVGSVEDAAFLERTFRGADAVYTMVPPVWDPKDWKEHIGRVGEIYASAIRAAGVKNVVNLSSIGAHLEDGAGPVSGLYRAEAALNKLEGVNVLHLRPGFFYYNFLANIPLVKSAGIIGGNYGDANARMVMSHTSDIAEAAAEALLALDFKGQSVRYLVSDDRKTGEVAGLIGKAIGKEELPWVGFDDEATLEALKGAGLTEEVARNYTEMGASMRSGNFYDDLDRNESRKGKQKLENFATEFAAAYNA